MRDFFFLWIKSECVIDISFQKTKWYLIWHILVYRESWQLYCKISLTSLKELLWFQPAGQCSLLLFTSGELQMSPCRFHLAWLWIILNTVRIRLARLTTTLLFFHILYTHTHKLERPPTKGCHAPNRITLSPCGNDVRFIMKRAEWLYLEDSCHR